MFMKDKKSASLFQKEQVMESLKQSFVKLNPRVMIKNPIKDKFYGRIVFLTVVFAFGLYYDFIEGIRSG